MILSFQRNSHRSSDCFYGGRKSGSPKQTIYLSQNWKEAVVQSASDWSVHLETKTEDGYMASPEVTQKVSPGAAQKPCLLMPGLLSQCELCP